MEQVVDLKSKGNYHFERAEYDDALEFYEKGLTTLNEPWQSDERPLNVHKLSKDEKNMLAALLKNQAACFMKRDRYEEAVKSCTRALAYNPTDTKATYRRILALEKMNAIGQAYSEARKLHQLAPKDKAVEKLVVRLRDLIEVKQFEERSTEKRVNSMFDVLVKEGALYKGAEKDIGKMKTAADNLIVLARDEAGAERIFREGGLDLLVHLLDSNVEDLHLSALRTLCYLAEGHKSRTSVILETVKMDRIRQQISSEREDISQASTSLLQTIMDSFKDQNQHKREVLIKGASMVFDYKDWLKGLIKMFGMMLNDRKVSGPGRDNILTLLTRNVPRLKHEYRTMPDPEYYIYFRQNQGLERLLAVASWSFEQTTAEELFNSCQHAPEKEPLKITANTQLNTAVCLLRFYDECGSDERRLDFIDICSQYIQYLFTHNLKDTDLLLNLRAVTVATTLLLGPDEVGFKILSSSGLFEVMISMTGDTNEVCQITAIEAILAAINKAKNATFVLENGTTLLKKLYKNSKLDSVRIRALVGLCKVGSSHGSDVSQKMFADGSSLKLARQCRKFLISGKQNLKKWAVEGLAYLTLDADVKEELCNDEACLAAIYNLAKNSTDMSIAYPSIHIFTNCTNSAEKQDDPLPEMIEIAKFAKHHVPEGHEKDNDEFTKERCKKLVKAKLVSILTVFVMSDHALITEGLRELITRILLTAAEDKDNRGLMVAHGGGKTLLNLARKTNTDKGLVLASQGVARLAITMNPIISFPGQKTFEAIRALLQLIKANMKVNIDNIIG